MENKNREEMIEFEGAFVVDPNSGKKHESWVKAVPAGEKIIYKGREVEFSKAYLVKIAQESRKAYAYFDKKGIENSGSPYRFPVLRNHTHSHDREGDLLEFKVINKHGFDGLWIKARWTEETLSAIEEKKIKHVSVGITPEYKTETGKTFGPLIREMSLTSDPYLKSIGTIQDTIDVELSNLEKLFDNIKKGEINMSEEMKEMMKAMMERFGMVRDLLGGEDTMDEDSKREILGVIDAAMEDLAEKMKEEEKPEQESEEESMEKHEEEEKDMSQEDKEVEVQEEPEIKEENKEFSELKAKVDKLEGILDQMNFSAITEKMKNLELAVKKGQSNMVSQPSGAETPKKEVVELANLSYDDRIDTIMEKEGCSLMEAIDKEIQMNIG